MFTSREWLFGVYRCFDGPRALNFSQIVLYVVWNNMDSHQRNVLWILISDQYLNSAYLSDCQEKNMAALSGSNREVSTHASTQNVVRTYPSTRAEMIRSAHDAIRCTIRCTRYNTFRDTFVILTWEAEACDPALWSEILHSTYYNCLRSNDAQ